MKTLWDCLEKIRSERQYGRKKGRKELKTSHAANSLSLISTGNFSLNKKKERRKQGTNTQLKRPWELIGQIFTTPMAVEILEILEETVSLDCVSWLPWNVDPPVDLLSLLPLSGLQPQYRCAFSIHNCMQCSLHCNEPGLKKLLGEFTAGKGPGKSSSHLYTIWSPIMCNLEHEVVNAEGPVPH